MKKLLTIMTAFVLALAVAMPVMAAGLTESVAKVEDATASDSYKTKPNPGNAKVDGTQENEILTLTYDAASLKIVHNGTGETTRPNEEAWVGVKVTGPSEAESFTVKQDMSRSTVKVIDESKLTSAFDANAKTFYEYFHVDKAVLDAAVENHQDYVKYALTYTWKYAEEQEETKNPKTTTIVVEIKVAGVELSDTEENEEVTLWNEEIYNKKVQVVADAEKAAAEANKKEPAKTEEDEKEPTPNTGVENVYAVAGLVAIVTLAGVVVLNKRK